MKIYQIREMADDELKATLKDSEEALQNYRFQLAAGQLENFSAIKNTRKDIARIHTVLKERKLANNEKANTKSKQ
ncbi:50S ribosomal protein L29 [Ignavibacteria bacterium CHB1]|jgi:LSU ribosomal protein L29P|nr:MAG: 50S ribosomal protein L29 [Chlorobiota bacterium]KXK06172.1 MAG: 50S ribosomal protein L29 [Chlorobi bacterium OLB4]MBV6398600.1 50S ribosomal protein L29 [Ignavibacteria bacterium]MCC6885835.1 50S ribosomal protein L29 [Ignavibacteriales bacterium]MCE7952970.1 50S ribosomal protein L29 [Chlorobi bacterium CHB7]MDL1887192.1 50S ribosomal protein L29 [Ignavibacteria bacterium CHB1]OQY78085.1 MAG: 50S ribosomal protein L29 [Ignavibacteriales bacterium UTCHB1]RIK49792.1 MAG: 50S ribosom